MSKTNTISSRGIDWAIIEMDYIWGFQTDSAKPKRHSYNSLARKYTIAMQVVAAQAKQKDWVRKREQANEDVNNYVMEAIKTDRVNQIVQFDSNAFTCVRIINSIVLDKLLEDTDDGTKRVKTSIDTLELQRLTTVVRNAVNAKKEIFGDVKAETSDSIEVFNSMLKKMADEDADEEDIDHDD